MHVTPLSSIQLNNLNSNYGVKNMTNGMVRFRGAAQVKKEHSMNSNNSNPCYNYANASYINFKGKPRIMNMENIAKDLTKWVEINNITSKTQERCKTVIDSLREDCPDDYSLLKDALIKLRNTSYIISDIYKDEKGNPSVYISQCMDLEKSDASIGEYRAYYYLNGELFDDNLSLD